MGIKGFGKAGATKIKDVKRDKTGSVVMETVATGMTVTATATAQANTNKTTVTPERYFVSMKWSNPRGSGADIALLQNGSVRTSITGQAQGATGTLSFVNNSPPGTPQSLTARFTWATAETSQVTGLTTTTKRTGVSITDVRTFTGLVASGVLPFSIQAGTADVALLQNGSVMASLTGQTGANTISYSLATETTSPTLTARFTWTSLISSIADQSTLTNTVTTTTTTADVTVSLTGTGTVVKNVVEVDLTPTGTPATVGVQDIAGVAAITTTKTFTQPGTITFLWTGTATSPSPRFSLWAGNASTATMHTRTHFLSSASATASPYTLRVKGFEGSASIAVNQIRTKALG